MVAEPATPEGSRWRAALGSIRFRITAVATVVAAAVLVFTGLVAVLAQRRALTDNLDDRLRQRAGDVTALVEDGTVPEQVALGTVDDTVVQLVGPDGQVVAASANATGAPPVAGPPPAGTSEELGTVGNLPGVEEESFRLLSVPIGTVDGDFVLHVAAETESVDESVAVLTVVLAITFPIVLVVLAVLIWLVVRRALRPVESIRTEVARISGSELDRRVPESPARDEISRLAHTMNEMLDRLEDAHDRQQRFVADASHELRSPLTGIRTELEVDLVHPETADLVATHRSILEEVERLQRLVGDLLLLARGDARASTARAVTVDLGEILLQVADSVRSAGRLEVDTTAVSNVLVLGNPDELDRALRNLLENAQRHAVRSITLGLDERDGTVQLIVADDGPGIPPDQAERVFERFARIDDARDRARGGTGLGLAITRANVERHGGTVAVDTTSPEGARFVVTLPAAG